MVVRRWPLRTGLLRGMVPAALWAGIMSVIEERVAIVPHCYPCLPRLGALFRLCRYDPFAPPPPCVPSTHYRHHAPLGPAVGAWRWQVGGAGRWRVIGAGGGGLEGGRGGGGGLEGGRGGFGLRDPILSYRCQSYSALSLSLQPRGVLVLLSSTCCTRHPIGYIPLRTWRFRSLRAIASAVRAPSDWYSLLDSGDREGTHRARKVRRTRPGRVGWWREDQRARSTFSTRPTRRPKSAFRV
jgi:hypothetical protein